MKNISSLKLSENKNNFSDYFEFKGYLGSGGYGTVLHAVSKEDGKSYAIKILKKEEVSKNDYETLAREARILSSLNHPNIVKFQGIKETDKRIFLVMDLVQGGTLKKLIKERKKSKVWFSDLESSTIMKKIFEAVSYMHSHGVIHRDLKPANILIEDVNDLNSIKIADFGVSAQFSSASAQTFTKKCGTMYYMAPELLFHPYHSKPVDIWSCGIMLYMLCSKGKHPLYKKSESNHEYFRNLRHPTWTFDSDFDSLAKSLFLRLVSIEAFGRYSADEALNHPWITRRKLEEVPWTANEFFDYFHLEQKLLNIMKCLYLLEHIKRVHYPNDYKVINYMQERPSSNQSIDIINITSNDSNIENEKGEIDKKKKYRHSQRKLSYSEHSTSILLEKSTEMVFDLATKGYSYFETPLKNLSNPTLNANYHFANLENSKKKYNIASGKNFSTIKSIISSPLLSRRYPKQNSLSIYIPTSPNKDLLYSSNEAKVAKAYDPNINTNDSYKITLNSSKHFKNISTHKRSHSNANKHNYINTNIKYPEKPIYSLSASKTLTNNTLSKNKDIIHVNSNHNDEISINSSILHINNLTNPKRPIFKAKTLDSMSLSPPKKIENLINRGNNIKSNRQQNQNQHQQEDFLKALTKNYMIYDNNSLKKGQLYHTNVKFDTSKKYISYYHNALKQVHTTDIQSNIIKLKH